MATKGKTETIRLPVGEIIVKLTERDPYGSGLWDYASATIKSNLIPKAGGQHGNEEFFGAMHAIESMVLGHACAGVDIQDPAYIEGIETAIEACENNL